MGRLDNANILTRPFLEAMPMQLSPRAQDRLAKSSKGCWQCSARSTDTINRSLPMGGRLAAALIPGGQGKRVMAQFGSSQLGSTQLTVDLSCSPPVPSVAGQHVKYLVTSRPKLYPFIRTLVAYCTPLRSALGLLSKNVGNYRVFVRLA